MGAYCADRGSSCCGSADLPAGVYVCAYTQVSGLHQHDREHPAGHDYYLYSDNFNSAKNLISTYAVIIKGNTVLNEVIDELDLDMTYGELYKMVEVADVDSTQIIKITVTDTDAKRAGEIVETIADIVPDVLVEKVEAGSCKTVSDVAINPNKVFPQTKKYVVLAGLLGAVVVCGVLVLAHLLHDTIVDDEDVQKKLGLPVLGLIPEV